MQSLKITLQRKSIKSLPPSLVDAFRHIDQFMVGLKLFTFSDFIYTNACSNSGKIYNQYSVSDTQSTPLHARGGWCTDSVLICTCV